MANICWFEMRFRGSKANCYAMLNSDIPCYEAYVKAENGTEEDYMMYVRGECRWSVTDSMVHVEAENTLAAKAAKFQLELEVCGLDESGAVEEHFHYKGSEVLKENNLSSSFPAWMIEDGEVELSEADLQKYTKIEEADIYVLKDEFCENFSYDEDLEEAVFDFTMSFQDLPGYEAPEEEPQNNNPFGSKEAILAMMGIHPDENGFAIDYSEEENSSTLFAYFGTAKTVIVPDGITDLEMGCFSNNQTVEEILLPQTVKVIGESCFVNCPNLQKIVIPASVASICEFDDDESFSDCPNLTIYTPANSTADRIARAKHLPVINDEK